MLQQLIIARKRQPEVSLITAQKQICYKRNTISTHTNTYDFSTRFWAESHKYFVQKILETDSLV